MIMQLSFAVESLTEEKSRQMRSAFKSRIRPLNEDCCSSAIRAIFATASTSSLHVRLPALFNVKHAQLTLISKSQAGQVTTTSLIAKTCSWGAMGQASTQLLGKGFPITLLAPSASLMAMILLKHAWSSTAGSFIRAVNTSSRPLSKH